MAEQEITLAELMRHKERGAKITQRERTVIVANIEQPPASKTMAIENFGELLDKLDTIVTANTTSQEAHFKLISELRTALLAIAKRSDKVPVVQEVSTKPMEAVLDKMRELARPGEQPVYEFEVVRSQQGFINKIIATPVAATKH